LGQSGTAMPDCVLVTSPPINAALLPGISVKYAPSGQNLEWLKQIRAGESVALHVRRGDYASNSTTQAIHGLCSREYYQEACRRISDHVKQPIFYIFSDDPSWVKQEFDYLENKKYVDNNSPLFNYEDLRLMSACRHQIIANSSFSWWAAWLNKVPGKKVHVPRNFLGFKVGQTYPVHIVPDAWFEEEVAL
jgi:hypothetical protein